MNARLFLMTGFAAIALCFDIAAQNTAKSQSFTNKCDGTVYKDARISSWDSANAEVTYQGGVVSVSWQCLPDHLRPKPGTAPSPKGLSTGEAADQLLRNLQAFERDHVIVKSGNVSQFVPRGIIVDESFYIDGDLRETWNFHKGSGVNCRVYRDYNFEWKSLAGRPTSFPRYVQVPWSEPPKK